MPPYETKCLQRIFDTVGLLDMVKIWLSEVIEDTHFNDYDYTIIVGEKLLNNGISPIFDNPMHRLSHLLDKSRIKIRFYDDSLMDYSIKIEWRVPVYREDGFRIGKLYIDDIFRGITCLPTIKKVIYNDPATIIFWQMIRKQSSSVSQKTSMIRKKV